jgi:hypothetical protein
LELGQTLPESAKKYDPDIVIAQAILHSPSAGCPIFWRKRWTLVARAILGGKITVPYNKDMPHIRHNIALALTEVIPILATRL